MAIFHVKGVPGLINGSYEILDESKQLLYRLVHPWHGWTLRIHDHSSRCVGKIGFSFTMLIWPEVIRHNELGSAKLRKTAFWRSKYKLDLPGAEPISIQGKFRKFIFYRGAREIGVATKKFWSLDHVYRVEIDEFEYLVFLLVTVALLGNFSSGSSSE